MPVQIIPGMQITSNLQVVTTRHHSIGVIEENTKCFTDTGLSFDGTRVTDVIREFYDLNGKEFEINPDPIIRVKKIPQEYQDQCRYSALVIAAKIDYDEGTLTYGWSVAVKTDKFSRERGEYHALDRLEKTPITIKYNPSLGIVDNICQSNSAPIQVFELSLFLE